jgi:hypothetical protein
MSPNPTSYGPAMVRQRSDIFYPATKRASLRYQLLK